jgi:hypothetical protein
MFDFSNALAYGATGQITEVKRSIFQVEGETFCKNLQSASLKSNFLKSFQFIRKIDKCTSLK